MSEPNVILKINQVTWVPKVVNPRSQENTKANLHLQRNKLLKKQSSTGHRFRNQITRVSILPTLATLFFAWVFSSVNWRQQQCICHQVWWCLPVIPAPEKLRQQDRSEFEASLGYTKRASLKVSKWMSEKLIPVLARGQLWSLKVKAPLCQYDFIGGDRNLQIK